jgi:four helix bundle protein
MKFEDLDAWQKARQVVNAIYTLCRTQNLSKDFGLCSQIQRAAVSVMSNIAEGFERQHIPEKLQAYNIARASCGEVRSLLYVVADNYATANSEALKLMPDVEVSGKLVSGLIASTQRRKSSISRLPSSISQPPSPNPYLPSPNSPLPT